MEYFEIVEKLKAAQKLLADIYQDPKMGDSENNQLSCADSCIGEILDLISIRGYE